MAKSKDSNKENIFSNTKIGSLLLTLIFSLNDKKRAPNGSS